MHFQRDVSVMILEQSGTLQDLVPEDKLRLLMVYAAALPDKMDPAKRAQWQKLARVRFFICRYSTFTCV